MPRSGAVLEFLTFLLAPIGYAGLTATMLVAARGRWPDALARLTVGVILTHVFLVWHVRYGWQFGEATRNGYAGFVIFHTALAAIVASLAVELRVARRLIVGAFAAVTIGAVAATFKYEVVANYRIPVLVVATTGIAGLSRRSLVSQG